MTSTIHENAENLYVILAPASLNALLKVGRGMQDYKRAAFAAWPIFEEALTAGHDLNVEAWSQLEPLIEALEAQYATAEGGTDEILVDLDRGSIINA